MNSFTKILWVLLSIIVLAGSGSAFSRPLSYDRYDDAIRHSVKIHWARCGPDWRWWKAQLYQESKLDPEARSAVGASGLAQFMPATWAEVQRQLGLSGLSPRAAGPAIDAGAFYMERLCRNWSSPRPQYDRLALAQASYNAGLGNLLKAQRECHMASLYECVAVCLPKVTGQAAQETLTYVSRIRHWREELR